MNFDTLIKQGRDLEAFKSFYEDYYKNGKMGGTRHALCQRIYKKLEEHEGQK